MKVYRTSKYTTSISEFELVKQTEVSVFIVNVYGKTERKDKVSDEENYHMTRKDAEQCIIDRLSREITKHERRALLIGDELTHFLESINEDS